MDDNVPRQITVGLRLREVDVLCIQEDGRKGIPDPLVLDRANELQRVLFTRDDDFLAIVKQLQQKESSFSGVIYAPQQLVSIGDCVRDLELIAKTCDLEDFTSHVQYLPL
ncbi:MAG: DUF5615 family PIN-like protein [Candidatus Parcubacteria bacterium]|uniref:DUF5615 family PIN-like protein n=1 Tax=Phormidesmis priestleyi TaxID=268141 RepID=UPI00083B80B1|nr:DUF5615 family PIN-like protein [Phormidesmis priestleyi]MBC7825619.1 DUF5615 family PIN-like protein [Leptolyngbyaceae cyanobacterium LF-bin-113]